MNTPFYIAKRYLWSKSNNNAINKITRIAAIGVIVATAALYIVLSGFAGLRDFSLSFANVFDADLKVYPETGKTFTSDASLRQAILKTEGVLAISEVIEERVYLNFKGKNHIATIKGVDARFGSVVPIDSMLFINDWFRQGENEVVLGLTASVKLSLGTYDYSELLEIYAPKPGTGQILDPTQAFRKERVVVTGIYNVNEEVDDTFLFADINLARRLLGYDENIVSGLEIKLDPGADPEEVKEALATLFGNPVDIKTRLQQNDALYKMLNTENVAVYLIFTLVLIIALFNVIGAIIMMILDKKGNLKTLQNMGLLGSEIRKIFYYHGFLLTAVSGVIGLVLGFIIVWCQLQFGWVAITPTLPYPVKPTVLNALVVLVTMLVLGLIAANIASRNVNEKMLAKI